MLSHDETKPTLTNPPRRNIFVDPNWIFPIKLPSKSSSTIPKCTTTSINEKIKLENVTKTTEQNTQLKVKGRDRNKPTSIKKEETKVKREVVELDDDMDDDLVITWYTTKPSIQPTTKDKSRDNRKGKDRAIKSEVDEGNEALYSTELPSTSRVSDRLTSEKSILGKRKRGSRGKVKNGKQEKISEYMGDDDEGDDNGTVSSQDGEEEWKSVGGRPLRKRVKVSYIDQGDGSDSSSSSSNTSDTYDESDDLIGDRDDGDESDDSDDEYAVLLDVSNDDDEGGYVSKGEVEGGGGSNIRDEGKGDGNEETGRVRIKSSRKDGILKPLSVYCGSTQKEITNRFGGDVKMYLEYHAEKSRVWHTKNKDKVSERHKAYRQRNKDKISDQEKAYRRRNKAKLSERDKAYYQRNKDKILERDKVYRQRNKDKVFKRGKAYRQRNKDKISEKKKAYEQRNKDKIAEKKKAYRQRNKDKISEERRKHRQLKKDMASERDKV